MRWMENNEGWLFSPQKHSVVCDHRMLLSQFKSRIEKGGTAKGTKILFPLTTGGAVVRSGD